jgi:hypothetical protein
MGSNNYEITFYSEESRKRAMQKYEMIKPIGIRQPKRLSTATSEYFSNKTKGY